MWVSVAMAIRVVTSQPTSDNDAWASEGAKHSNIRSVFVYAGKNVKPGDGISVVTLVAV